MYMGLDINELVGLFLTNHIIITVEEETWMLLFFVQKRLQLGKRDGFVDVGM